MRDCIRCGGEMKEKNCQLKWKVQDMESLCHLIKANFFAGRLGRPKVAICPKCGEISIYIADVAKLNKSGIYPACYL